MNAVIHLYRFPRLSAAGQDATDVFFSLHRHEVLLQPQYARLQIGTIEGEEEQIKAPQPGELSRMPYGEAPWLTPSEFYSFLTFD